jgi:hypothetical protein
MAVEPSDKEKRNAGLMALLALNALLLQRLETRHRTNDPRIGDHPGLGQFFCRDRAASIHSS